MADRWIPQRIRQGTLSFHRLFEQQNEHNLILVALGWLNQLGRPFVDGVEFSAGGNGLLQHLPSR